MDFLKKLSFRTVFLALGALVAAGLLWMQSYEIKNTKQKLERTEINLKAAQDSLRTSKAKDGSVEYDKFSFIVNDLKELKKINEQLAKEVAFTKGKVLVLQKMDAKIVHDTVLIPDIKPTYKDGVVVITGHHDTTYSPNNYRNLSIETTYNQKDSVGSQKIVRDEIGFSAITGLKESKQGYEIFVRPKYPGFTLTNLEGAIIDKNLFKKKVPLITIGGHVGWAPVSYDLMSKNFFLHPARLSGSVGLNFNLNRK
jgi:hypothetical protein